MYTHTSSPLHAARDYAHQVIVAISPYLLLCKCVEQLLPHLVRRGVVASKVRSIILSQSDTEAASSLERLLNGRSREQELSSMVEGVYLALLDCYEESGSVWCHGMAVSGIQPVVRFKLKLPDINFDDLAVIHQRVSSTNLPEGDAAMLTEKLGLSNYGPIVDLKKIIQIAPEFHYTSWCQLFCSWDTLAIPQPALTLLPQQPTVCFATAHQFHIPEWSSDYQWCGDVNAMVSVIEEVSKVQRKTGNHPIVVHG
ncbi:hypothetical protein GBAR_LOCUS22924, partial [Geodia barretti]